MNQSDKEIINFEKPMNNDIPNMAKSRHIFSMQNKIGRMLWNIVCCLLFRPFGLRVFKKWRVLILRCFGAKVSCSSVVHSSAKIWAPWNLEVGDFSCIGPHADCYNQGKVTIGANVVISQRAYICASTHNYTLATHDLLLCPVVIESQVWIAADAFIGPDVTIGEGAVVGARAAVFKDVEPWTVVGGNPAKFIKKREIKNEQLM